MRVDLTNPQPSRPAPGTISLKDAPRVVRNEAPLRSAPQKRPQNGRHVIVGIVSMLVLLAAASSYVALSHSSLFAQNGPQEARSLVASVGSLMLLPQNETPTIATVADLHALSGEAFFDHAQIGDKVLIYPKAQKAILYRPSSNKIIEVAPVTNAAP